MFISHASNDTYNRRSIRKLIFISTLTCLIISHSLGASEKLVWGFSVFPPFLYLDESGTPQGKYSLMVESLFKHANIEYSALPAPNRRTRQLAKEGGLVNFAIAPKTIFTEADAYYISDFPVATIDAHVFWKPEKPPITNVKELLGKDIIVISSYSYNGVRETISKQSKHINMVVEDHRRAVLALTKNRADYMLGYYAPTQYELKNLDIKTLPNLYLNTTKMYLVISKSVKNGQQLMEKLERAYIELYGDVASQ